MNKEFGINSYTATLVKSKKENSIHIINNGKWIIPIYQRPYSWEEKEVEKLLRDIFNSYWGQNYIVVKEPMFIGTMQVSNSKSEKRDVIDGQQRLTTFLLLITVIKLFNTDNSLNYIDTNWIESKVNKGEAQKDLNNAIKLDVNITSDHQLNNRYSNNKKIIYNFLLKYVKNEDEGRNLSLIDFTNYILEDIYFVCIETKATLSKTLQIFESINATGMSLNGGDLFKVNFYEYLTLKQQKEESVFEDISELYAKIDIANKKSENHVTDINNILTIYKYVLISKHNLPNTLHFLGTNVFYERLFNKLLNNINSEGFSNKINNVILSIEDLTELIDLRIEWHNSIGKTGEEELSYYFIMWSRYSRYWISIIAFQFAFSYKLSSNDIAKYQITLSKLLFIYSIKYRRAVNECHRLIRDISKLMFTSNKPGIIIEALEKEIKKHASKGNMQVFEWKLNEPITGNHKHKNLICRLSAMLDEDYLTEDLKSIKTLRKNLFWTDIDIEHIQSYKDFDKSKRLEIWEKWGKEINSLGNLIVLERKLNQSISNNNFLIKKKTYDKSIYRSVKTLSANHQNWTLDTTINRKKEEVKKIKNYIFNNTN